MNYKFEKQLGGNQDWPPLPQATPWPPGATVEISGSLPPPDITQACTRRRMCSSSGRKGGRDAFHRVPHSLNKQQIESSHSSLESARPGDRFHPNTAHY